MNLPRILCYVVACLAFAAGSLSVGCAPTTPATQSARDDSQADQLAIKQLVLNDLFDHQEPRLHPVRDSISAYVIEDPQYARQLAGMFKGHVPPVLADKTTQNEQGEDIDEATGKPVEVYSARVREINCETARVGAGWRSAPLEGVWYSYDLVRVNGLWQIKKRQVVGVA